MSQVSWKKYIDKRKNAPPRVLLMESVLHAQDTKLALDLGAGAMNDSCYLLGQGFERVIAVDYDNAACEYAQALNHESRFTFVQSRFEDFDFPSEVSLVNAAYSLPFNRPETFSKVVVSIKNSLKKGGIFCGQLFGENDEWNIPGSGKTFLTHQQVVDLFEGMHILKFVEEEDERKSALGKMKHFHVFHFIVRK